MPWREKMVASQSGESSGARAEMDTSLESLPSLPPTNQMVREEVFESYFASSLKRDPYKVVVAEMMLQQTQVERVLPKYFAWLERWPTAQDLASAELSEVLIFWQGLGYNRRAKFLWKLARAISERSGVWPTTEKELLLLPGIGKYTARAIQSFAFGQQVGVVDTNIQRVIARITGIAWEELQDVNSAKTATEKMKPVKYFELADTLLPKGLADPWNQAIMDLGAMICTARAPKCEKCPLKTVCKSNVLAVKSGSPNFADFLQQKILKEKKSGKKSIPSGVPKVRFEDSDRFFRGRILDLLRVRALLFAELKNEMDIQFGLDSERFEKIIAGLIKEELVSEKNGVVKLG